LKESKMAVFLKVIESEGRKYIAETLRPEENSS
jgi:hypothetical protein